MTEQRYLRPGWFAQHVFNPFVRFLTRRGLSVYGSRELRVRGRTSGEWRATPVNLLDLDGQRYLAAWIASRSARRLSRRTCASRWRRRSSSLSGSIGCTFVGRPSSSRATIVR